MTMLAAIATMEVTAVTSRDADDLASSPAEPDAVVPDYPVFGYVRELLTQGQEERRKALQEAAVSYARKGWLIVPVRHVSEEGLCVNCYRGADCTSQGKHPIHDNWPHHATSDSDEVASWWRRESKLPAREWFPEANIGIVTGAGSGIFVLDVDLKPYRRESGKKGQHKDTRIGDTGHDTLIRLEAAHERLPETRIHSTGSGGTHFFFKHPGFDVRNSAGKLLGWGLDIKGKNGFVVAPPSLSSKGVYELNPAHDVEVAEAPEWLLDMLRQDGRHQNGAPAGPAHPSTAPERARRAYADKALKSEAAKVRNAAKGERNNTLNEAAFSLGTLAEECGLDKDRALGVLLDAALSAGLDEGAARATFLSGWHAGLENPRQIDWRTAAAGDGALHRVDVTNPAKAGAWLRKEMGRGELSGLFIRDGGLVHTPMVGQDGYIDPTPAEKTRRIDHGPAQIQLVTADHVKAQVAVSYDVGKKVKDGDKEFWVQAFFPREAAQDSVNAALLGIGCPNLETLHGVTHTPIMRRDGSILETPGYDLATGLLYLPDRGLTVPQILEHPSPEQVSAAVKLLLEPVAEFPFVKDHHRANWLGMMITPLLREMLPGPYQMGVISAPNSGSGKGYLAGLIRIVHGMVMRGEMPREREEMRKTLISTLLTTTAPVVLFDNVRGEIYSSELEALLTSETLADRVLGQSRIVNAQNDRLWLVTGNNAKVGGDMARRLLEVHIDPKCSDPSARTFAIPDLMGWMEQRRGDYIAALLTVARGWVLAGAPSEIDRSDNFARWRGSLRGLLHWAGVDGSFGNTDDSDTAAISEEISEWHGFLEALQGVFGKDHFGSRDVVAALRATEADRAADGSNARRMDAAALPGPLEEAWEKAARTYGYGSFTRSLGKWIGNRDGRFTMGLAVRTIPTSGKKSAKFVIEAEDTSDV